VATASVHLESYAAPGRGLHAEAVRARVLAEVVHAATRSVSGGAGAVLGLLADRVTLVMGDACAVRLVSEDGKRLDVVTLRASDGQAEALALGGEASDGSMVPAAQSPWLKSNASALVTVPLTVGTRTIGTLTAVRVAPSPPYSQEERRFLAGLADVAALAVENARLAAGRHRLERLAAAGQLAAGVAHDLNNVVTVVKVYAELLAAGSPLDDVGRDRLDAIRTQADRAVSLAWQVLDTARRQPPELVDVRVVPFVAEFADVVRRLLPAGVSLDVRAGGADQVVRADPSRLHQILTNLVANAVQAVADEGRVTIGVSSSDGPGGGDLGPALVRIDVADTGPGIAPDVLPRVFEPFFSTKPPGRGSGLGLTQVRALVAEHGGHAAITSTPGDGTVVSLWLPAAGSTAHPDEPLRVDERLAGRRGVGEPVLVVEDDAGLREALVDALTSLGYRPDAVDDGEEALAWVDAHGGRVWAVVSERAMAGLGGEGLARRMAVAWPDVPVILTTSALCPPPAEPGLRLPKPFSVEQLARVLAAARP